MMNANLVPRPRPGLLLAGLLLAAGAGTASAATVSYTNAAAITIPGTPATNRASPYPSTITVSNLSGLVTKAVVRLHRLTHTFPEDLDVLLVAPDGRGVLLMSDAGAGDNITALTLVFDDAAANRLPQAGPLSSGTYLPADYTNVFGNDVFPTPAPAAPFGTNLSALIGLSPKGVWSLYLQDDFPASDNGALGEGWSLTLAVDPVPIVINEWQAYPTPGNADFIELLNTGNTTVDLSGFFFTDDLDSPQKFQLPANTSLASGSRLVLFGSGQTFDLNPETGSIGLFSPAGGLIDAVT